MMLTEIEDMLRCDVFGDDDYYLNKLDFKDEDYYNIRRMADNIKSNVSEENVYELMVACAMLVYCANEGKIDDLKVPYLQENLNDNVHNKLQPLFDEAFDEYNCIKKEEELEDGDKERSSDS